MVVAVAVAAYLNGCLWIRRRGLLIVLVLDNDKDDNRSGHARLNDVLPCLYSWWRYHVNVCNLLLV